MADVKFKKIEKQSFCINEIYELGYSILDNKHGNVIDRKTGKLPEMKINGSVSQKALDGCTIRDRIGKHIDIMCNQADIVYDMGCETEIQKAIITSYYHPFGYGQPINYSIGEFKLYVSNDLSTLFNDCNEVAHECGKDYWTYGLRNNADWGYEVNGSFRYFGIRVLNSNPTDDIIRLGYIGLYNNDYTFSYKFLLDNYPENIFAGQQPRALTDNCVFDDGAIVAVDGEQKFTFDTCGYKKLSKIWVIGSGELNVSVEGFPTVAVSEIEKHRKEYVFETEGTEVENGSVTVNVKGKGSLDQIGGFCKNRAVKVELDDVICDDFMGIGANVLPMSFMPENIESGYNAVYWELEKERIRKSKPNVVRMWFQPDWLCQTYEDYKNGDYDFECQKLQSVYRYLDVFNEIGTEIEFNFGWKVSGHAQEWFSRDVGDKKRNSAPKDLELFAKCCGATLYEFIKKRGYKNIKYLTFYNEPDTNNYNLNGDFCVGIGMDRRPYWEEMMRKAYAELQRLGLEQIEMWGSEQCSTNANQIDWTGYMSEHCSDILKCHTCHRYHVNHNDANVYFEGLKSVANDIPIMLTECGQLFFGDRFSWEKNQVQLFHDLAANGISGALIWSLNGIYITDPCFFLMSNNTDYWDAPQSDCGIENVRENYYSWAMLSRYIPNHSKSVKTEILDGDYSNIRASAFTSGDDVTVVLELNNSITDDRNIEIKLSKAVGKKFYKHVYRMPCIRNGNAIMPPVCGIFEVGDTILDTVNSDYQEVVYTTIPPVVQVAMAENEVFLKRGQDYALNAGVIDGNGGVEFELAAEVGDSAEFDSVNNTVRFGENAKKGDMFAIKATAVRHKDAANVTVFKVSD